jgi:hypothetical protein
MVCLLLYSAGTFTRQKAPCFARRTKVELRGMVCRTEFLTSATAFRATTRLPLNSPTI